VAFWIFQDCKKREFISPTRDFIFSGSPEGQLPKKCTPKIASEASKWALLLEFFAWESKGWI
jgi:hypothetical protein